MRKLTNSEIKNLIILELVYPNVEEYPQHKPILTEVEQKSVMDRYKESKDWNYVFEPIEDHTTRWRIISLFQELDKDG